MESFGRDSVNEIPANLNDYVLPAPGSIVTGVCGPNDRSKHEVFTVVASREQVYPGNWKQYFITLLGNERIIGLDLEYTDFHYNWHVLLRP